MASKGRRTLARDRHSRSLPRKGVAVGIVALLLLLLGLVVWHAKPPTLYEPDTHAAPLTSKEPLSLEEMQEQLQAQADKYSFRLQLNSRPRVLGNQAELFLGNPVENQMDLSVILTLDEGGETLYNSGSLVPGAQVLSATLLRELSPGEYPATAVCTAIDPETGQAVGIPALFNLMLIAEKPQEPTIIQSVPLP